MKEKMKQIFKSYKLKLGVVFLVVFVISFFVIFSALAPKKYSLKEGDIAREDIKAPYDVEDTVSTEEIKREVLKSVQDQYVVKKEVKEEVIQSIESFFSYIIEVKATDLRIEINDNVDNIDELTEEEKISIEEERKRLKDEAENEKINIKINMLKQDSQVKLSDENYKRLIELKPYELEELKIFLENVMSKLYDQYQLNAKKVENNVEYSEYDGVDVDQEVVYEIRLEDQKKAQDYIESEFNKSEFPKNTIELGKSIGFTQVKANVVYDETKTQKLRDEALEGINPVMIKKDQLIVKEGEPVTVAQIEVLRELSILDETDGYNWILYLCIGVLIISIMIIQSIYLYKYHKEIFLNIKSMILINSINTIGLILARMMFIASPYLIPLAWAPMVIALLIDDKVSIVVSVINVFLISAAVQFNLPITILALLNAVIGVIMLKNMDQRSDILYSSLFIAIINGLFVFLILVLQHGNKFVMIITNSGLAFLASILAGVLTIGFLPLFEGIFDIVTTIKLLELSNPNNPLLKRLLIEAPGTYHHSILVSNLAELGAEAVGANSVLARVAAYYHDVGKLKRPYFFKENQKGDNPHNNITPNLSTLIILSHVKDGIELAKENKIPKVIQDIIQQHHGTSLVKYFYVTMKNNSEKPEEVKKEDFMYQGPIPSTKEAAIVMLADGVEAAVRSITEPTKGKIEEMVNNIIKNRLHEGQLDDCDLTLKDLEKIRKAFLKGLSGIYHERIEYPKLSDKL